MKIFNLKKQLQNVKLPISPDVLEEARRLVGNGNARMDTLAFCVSQDPALTLAILKNANSMFFSEGKKLTTSIKSAAIRLGSETIISILYSLGNIKNPKDKNVLKALNLYRDKSKRAAIVARMFAESINKSISDESLVTGLFLYLGYILSLLTLQENFLEIAEDNPPPIIRYKIFENYKINIEQSAFTYLINNNISNVIIEALDKDADLNNNKDKILLRNIVWSAYEFVEAFDNNKWKKFAPGNILSPKNPIRSLFLTEQQYGKIYERAAGFFISNKLFLKKKYQMGDESQPFDQNEDDETTILENQDIQQFFLNKEDDDFDLGKALSEKKDTPRKENSTVNFIEPKPSYLKKANTLIQETKFIFDNTTTSEDAITKILDILVNDGGFKRAAIVVVSEDKKSALVVCARGSAKLGQRIPITDELSPLVQCFSKLQSFGNKESQNSPFNSASYALSPIDVDHSTPVSLYADCGKNTPLTFEARRVFRNVVDILNQKLPTLLGGIPIEIKLH